MTININTYFDNVAINMTAEQITGGRHEKWKLTFDRSIEQIPDEIIKKAASTVSWLWMPTISRTGNSSVIYSGYID